MRRMRFNSKTTEGFLTWLLTTVSTGPEGKNYEFVLMHYKAQALFKKEILGRPKRQ